MRSFLYFFSCALISIAFVFMLQSCIGPEVDPEAASKLGYYEVSIEGDLNEQLRFEGACANVFAHNIPMADAPDEYHSIMV